MDFKTAFIFGVPSIVSIFLTRNFLLSLIPDEVFRMGNFIVTKDIFLLLLFAGLMIVSSYKMIQKSVVLKSETINSEKNNTLLAAGEGFVVGILTGLIGAGGGFMIIPALVNLLKTPMKVAIGTSLVIIFFKFSDRIFFINESHQNRMEFISNHHRNCHRWNYDWLAIIKEN